MTVDGLPQWVEKQIVTFPQRCYVINDIDRKLDGDAIFLAGTAYQSHVVNALMRDDLAGGVGDTLNRIRYSKDVDFFTSDVSNASNRLEYIPRDRRVHQYVVDEGAQRKVHVGENRAKRELKVPPNVAKILKEIGTEIPETVKPGETIPAYLGIDIMGSDFYTSRIPDSKKEKVLRSLNDSKVPTKLFGENTVYVAGIPDLFLSKTACYTGDRRMYKKDDFDIAHLVLFFTEDELGLGYACDVLGEDAIRERLGVVRETMYRAGEALKAVNNEVDNCPELKESTFMRLKKDLEVPEDLGASEDLILDHPDYLVEELDKLIDKF